MQQRLPAFAPRDKHDGLAKAAQRPLPQDPRLVRAQKSARSGEKEEGEVSDDEPELQIVVGISRGAGRSSQDHGRDVCHKRSEQIGGGKKLEVVTLLSSSEDDDEDQPTLEQMARLASVRAMAARRHDPSRRSCRKHGIRWDASKAQQQHNV